MAITRTPIVDDDGSGQTGTVIDNAWKQELYDQIDGVTTSGTSGVVTIATGGTYDVILPTPRPFYYVRPAATAEVTINSLTAGRAGDVVLIENVGTLPVWLANNVGSLARLANRVTSGATPLGLIGSALYVYDAGAGKWVLAQHDQGSAIRMPYSAANYNPGNGTWTVEAGDVQAHDYFLKGNELTIHIKLVNTTTGSNPYSVYVGGFPFTMKTPERCLGVWAGAGSAPSVVATVDSNPNQGSIYFQRIETGPQPFPTGSDMAFAANCVFLVN